MLLKLQDGSELEIADMLTREESLGIFTDDAPETQGPGCAVYINRSEAIAVVAHICAVFGLKA